MIKQQINFSLASSFLNGSESRMTDQIIMPTLLDVRCPAHVPQVRGQGRDCGENET